MANDLSFLKKKIGEEREFPILVSAKENENPLSTCLVFLVWSIPSELLFVTIKGLSVADSPFH